MKVGLHPGQEILLNRLEEAGLKPDYQCRNGYCGHCVSRLEYGEVEYVQRPIAFFKTGEVVLCCAKAITNVVLEIE